MANQIDEYLDDHLKPDLEVSQDQEQQDAKMKDLKRCYAETFTSGAGRKVLKDLMTANGFLTPCFHSDPMIAAKNEGERGVVLNILSMITGASKLTDSDISERMIDAIKTAKQTGE